MIDGPFVKPFRSRRSKWIRQAKVGERCREGKCCIGEMQLMPLILFYNHHSHISLRLSTHSSFSYCSRQIHPLMATISHRAPGQAHVVTAALLASTVASSPLPPNRRWLHSSHTPNVSASDRRRNDSSSQKSSDRSSLGQPARREGVNDEDSDSAVGFGGASSSSLPHTSSPSGASGRGDGRRPSPSTSQNGAQNASRPSRRAPPPASMLISGSAGKGAIPGYGKMNMAGAVPDQSRMTTRERDDEMVRGYEHSVSSRPRARFGIARTSTDTLAALQTVCTFNAFTASYAASHILFHPLDFFQCSYIAACSIQQWGIDTSWRPIAAEEDGPHLSWSRLSVRRHVPRHLPLLQICSLGLALG